jgi:tripartite-type tricarboxylate transporter receptor subunit TctC
VVGRGKLRRTVVLSAVGLGALLAGCGSDSDDGGDGAAASEGFPSKSITIVVPYEAGGGSTPFVQAVAEAARKYTDVDIRVENRPGAGGVTGVRYVLDQEPDGHTLLYASLAQPAAGVIRPDVDISPDDFTYLGALGSNNFVIAVPADDERSFKELLDLAAEKPGSLSYSNAGPSGSDMIGMEALLADADVGITAVPFEGGGAALTAVAGKQVDMAILSAAPAMQGIEAGQLRPVAVTGPERLTDLPDVPTAGEVLGTDYEYLIPSGIVAANGLPDAARDYLIELMQKIAADEEFQKTVTANGQEPIGIFGSEYEDYIQNAITTRVEPAIARITGDG